MTRRQHWASAYALLPAGRGGPGKSPVHLLFKTQVQCHLLGSLVISNPAPRGHRLSDGKAERSGPGVRSPFYGHWPHYERYWLPRRPLKQLAGSDHHIVLNTGLFFKNRKYSYFLIIKKSKLRLEMYVDNYK